MDLAKPHEAVVPSLHGAVLISLHTAAAPLSGRAVAERAGASHEGTRRVLRRLVEHGLVDEAGTRSSILYSLNRDHVLAPAVAQLAGARTELFSRMATLVSGWQPRPLSVTVYGSAARGSGDANSDVDVFVVRDDREGFSHWEEHLPALAESVRAWSGNAAEIIEYSHTEVREAARTGLPLLESVVREGRHLFGKPLHRLVLDARRDAA